MALTRGLSKVLSQALASGCSHFKLLVLSRRHAAVVLLGVLLLGLTGEKVEARPDDVSGLSEDLLQELPAVVPCGFRRSKTVAPRSGAVGDELGVEVKFDYDCKRESDAVSVMLATCNGVAHGFGNPEELAQNLREGMSSFVNKIPADAGSAVGMIVFNSAAFTRAPLSGSANRNQLLHAIAQLDTNESMCSSVNTALIQAYKQLPTQLEDTNNFIVLFDTGAPPNNACDVERATRVGVEIAVIQLPAAGGRWCPCSTLGCFTTADDEGSNLVEIYEHIVEAIVRRREIKKVRISDKPDDTFAELVNGSWNLPPVQQPPGADEYLWEYDSQPRPAEGWELSYRIKLEDEDGLAPVAAYYEQSSEARLDMADGSTIVLPLERQHICIARPGRILEDCQPFLPPPSPVPTATPVVSPTPSATATPLASNTPSATETDDLHENGVYLPLLYREFER